jgi:SAM-dependent methyltransferase
MVSDLSTLQPTKRFSNRAANYVKYRPSYPEAIIPFLEDTIGLKPGDCIADMGSGTGLFSELLLKRGYGVIGIEPNEEMRKAGENRLSQFPGFGSSSARAEETGLPSASIDLITVAQAFHWMEPLATKREFLRILKPEGHIVLAWNLRQTDTAFLSAYEALKARFGIDYRATKMVDDQAIEDFYRPWSLGLQKFQHTQRLDFESLKGQLLSASYIPLPGHPTYEAMIDGLVELFVRFNERGLISMEYETRLYWNKS